MSSLEVTFGSTLVTKSGIGSTSDCLQSKKFIGIYFSAHWCPPCRGFTPTLVEFYNDAKEAGAELEIIFVSSDKDQASFDQYYGSMPWLALPMLESEKRQALASRFSVSGIPTFIVLRSDNTVVDTDGRSTVQAAKGNVQKALAKWSDFSMSSKSLSHKENGQKISFFKILLSSIFSFVVAGQFINNLSGDVKQYKTFQEFYPFYLSQHSDQTCRRLHFVGTSIVVLMLIFRPNLSLSMIPAYLLGSAVQILTQQLSTGLIEALAAMGILLLSYKSLTGRIKEAVILLLIGYGFAWVGHFVFEKNRPATFIYPIYSLRGDFTMWYEIATCSRDF